MSDESTATVAGKIIHIDSEKQITDTFKKREWAVETDGNYPQQIGMECVQKDCSLLDGFSIGDTAKLAEEGVDCRELAERGANLFLEMIFRDRFFHADPHPGNLLVLPGNVVGLIDCGMVGYLDHLTKDGIEGLIEGFLAKDADLITDYALLLGDVPKDFDRDDGFPLEPSLTYSLNGAAGHFVKSSDTNDDEHLDQGYAHTTGAPQAG